MCKYKDTNIGIKKIDFGVKRGYMAFYLTDSRIVIVPVSMFPEVKRLTKSPAGRLHDYGRPILLVRCHKQDIFGKRRFVLLEIRFYSLTRPLFLSRQQIRFRPFSCQVPVSRGGPSMISAFFVLGPCFRRGPSMISAFFLPGHR